MPPKSREPASPKKGTDKKKQVKKRLGRFFSRINVFKKAEKSAEERLYVKTKCTMSFEDWYKMHRLKTTPRGYEKLPADVVANADCPDIRIVEKMHSGLRKLFTVEPVVVTDTNTKTPPKRPVILVLGPRDDNDPHAGRELAHELVFEISQGRRNEIPYTFDYDEFRNLVRAGPSADGPRRLVHRITGRTIRVIHMDECHELLKKAPFEDEDGVLVTAPERRRGESSMDATRRYVLEQSVVAKDQGDNLFIITDCLGNKGVQNSVNLYRELVMDRAKRSMKTVYLTRSKGDYSRCLFTGFLMTQPPPVPSSRT